MHRRVAIAYPLLFAAGLVVYVAATNPGQYRLADFGVVMAAVLTVAAAILAIATSLVVVADRAGKRRALIAPITMIGIAWFFFYAPVQQVVQSVSWRLSRGVVLVPIALIATALALWSLARASRARVDAVNRFLATAGLFLVGISTAELVLSRGATRASGPFARSLAAPIHTNGPAAHNSPKRDIYLLVLDGHANDRVLREVFGVRDFAFTDSLRALGFVVPNDMRSNYTQTVLSLPSLLNFEHMTRLAGDAGETSTDFSVPRALIERNRTATFLKAQGYKYVLFPSAYSGLTENSPLADERFDARAGFDLGDELNRSELRLAVARSTLLRSQLQRGHVDSLHPIRSLRGVPAIARDPAPTFTFLHVLLPHVPFVFDANCRTLAHPFTETIEADTPEQRAAYLAQMHCVDGLVLDVVTRLLRDSPVKPVILVVGDHGSRFTDIHYFTHPDRVSPAFARERFGALGAFYLPDGGDREFGESLTLVNVMRNVLRYYFDAPLPRLPDDMYTSGLYPFKLHRVDARWLAER